MINENDECSGSRYMLRSKTDKQNPTVQHDPVEKMFFIKLGTSKAFISYTTCANEKNIIQMDHTEVPEMYNGKGFGKLLAKFAFDYCVENDYKMRLNCTFLQHYLNKYAPKYLCHVVKN